MTTSLKIYLVLCRKIYALLTRHFGSRILLEMKTMAHKQDIQCFIVCARQDCRLSVCKFCTCEAVREIGRDIITCVSSWLKIRCSYNFVSGTSLDRKKKREHRGLNSIKIYVQSLQHGDKTALDISTACTQRSKNFAIAVLNDSRLLDQRFFWDSSLQKRG